MTNIQFFLHNRRLSYDQALEYVTYKLRYQLNSWDAYRMFDLAVTGDAAHIPMIRGTGLEWLTESVK